MEKKKLWKKVVSLVEMLFKDAKVNNNDWHTIVLHARYRKKLIGRELEVEGVKIFGNALSEGEIQRVVRGEDES